jgi:hypothetical protein
MLIKNEQLTSQLSDKWVRLGFFCKSDQNFIYLFHHNHRVNTFAIIRHDMKELDANCEHYQIQLDSGKYEESEEEEQRP